MTIDTAVPPNHTNPQPWNIGFMYAWFIVEMAINRKTGMAPSLLYTADGPEQIPNGSLPGLPAVINFGTGSAKHSFGLRERTMLKMIKIFGILAHIS